MALADEAKNAKKLLPSSRKEVDAKFLSRGVTPSMIREATAVDKCEVAKLRHLLNVFEEAHERGWEVAKGPWSDAVVFYQTFFSVKLPDVELESRELLIVDFLKRCWSVVQRPEAEGGPTVVVDLTDARDGSVLAPEIPISGVAVLEGVPPGSAAKLKIPEGASTSVVVAAKLKLPEGASTSVVVVPPGKLGSLVGEADADYEKVAAQVAEQRAKEMAAFDAEISKRESAIEEEAARYHLAT